MEQGPDYGYQRIRFHKKDEVNPYAAERDKRHAMDSRTRILIVLAIVLLAVFFLAATLPTELFSPIYRPDKSIAGFLRDFVVAVQAFIAFLTGGAGMYSTYVWEVVAAGLAGAALGMSGGVYQGALKNALASPATLGVSSGGTLGLIIYGLFFLAHGYNGSASAYQAQLLQMNPLEYMVITYGQVFATMIGCLAVVAVIMFIAFGTGHGKVTNISIIIAGQVFTAAITVVLTWIRYYLIETSGNSDLVNLLSSAQTASFSGLYSAATILMFAIPVFICMGVILAMASRLSLLAFSDDEARSMGISTHRMRIVMVVLCTILTALTISFCGPAGFVGFMVPHMARKVIGADFRFLLPASALLGAILVIAVNYITTLGIPGIATGSTNMITSVVGCIMFIVMALRQRGSSHGEWV